MYNGRELDTLRRFAVFFIDMTLVNLCINLITAPILAYFESELGSLQSVVDKLNVVLENFINGMATEEELLNMSMGLLKYGLLVLLVTLPVSLLIFFLYFVLQPMKTKYQTLGRKLMHARVERLDGEPLSYKTLCIRELVGSLLFYNILGGILMLITLIVYFTSKRSLVDHISKTNLYDLNKSVAYNQGNYNGYNSYDNNGYNNNYNNSYDNNYDNNSYNNYDDNNYDNDDNNDSYYNGNNR